MTTQRDRLAAVLHETYCGCASDPEPCGDERADLKDADALLARGVRVVDTDAIAAALHRGCGVSGLRHPWENCPAQRFYREEAAQTIKRLDAGDTE